MTKKRKYFYRDTDRHGNVRWYFKPPGCKKIRLKSAEGTPEFRIECDALWVRMEHGTLETKPTSRHVSVDSVEWFLKSYQASWTFQQLSESTQTGRRNYYIRFNRFHGTVPYLNITSKDISDVRDAFGEKKSGAQNFVKAMRAAWAWASHEDQKLILPDQNVMKNVALPKVKTTGYNRWSMDQVLQFRDFYPKYSTPRKALACLLFTGGRVSDVRLMGRRKVSQIDGRFWLSITQEKTGNPVEIPVIGLLKDELGDDFDQLIWILTEFGAPFSRKSISNKVSYWARRAGLPKGYSAHGLRKSLGSILAELGLSEDVIMTILGHTTSKEVRTYIVNVNRRRLAEQGMDKFEEEVAHFWNSNSQSGKNRG